MTAPADAALGEGMQIEGFRVQRITPLPGVRATAVELVHEKTAAQILHVHTEDAENLFAIIFATPPEDDRGLPHILEHAVLSGSRRFRAKDPFFEMRKMSMATFLNAMTAYDSTYYPVASNVKQDFWNLAEVYWDAAFFPLLTEQTFRREGHRLELANPQDSASDLIIKGIVYNEMKGAFSSPTTMLSRWSFRGLFPDTPYARESGGDPEAIPQLTYEQFRRFHQRYYHPSNARIFLYGNIPTTEHIRFLNPKLDEFSAAAPAEPIAHQPRWPAPQTITQSYPIAPGDDPARRTFVTLNWLVGETSDALLSMAFEVLDYILLGNEAAPLRRAIVDSQLGEDLILSGFRTFSMQSHFHVGLQGTEPDRREAFEKLVVDTLRHLADTPFETERVEAAFQQLAFEYLEIGSQYPMQVMYRVVASWLYGADPLTLLRADELMNELKRRWRQDPTYFGQLIREKLIDNPHRLALVLVPDRQMQAQKDAALTEDLRRRRDALSSDDLQRIIRQAEELERAQNEPNKPEDIASLPQLTVSDLPRRPRHIPTIVEPIEPGLDVLHNDVFANGVNYLHLTLDLSALPEDLWAWLPLYGECVRKMGAGGEDFARLADRIAAHTGGVAFSAGVEGRADDPAGDVRFGTFTLKFVDSKVEPALRVLRDLMFDLDVRDDGRLRDILNQGRAAQRNAFVNNGMGIGLLHAARSFGGISTLGEQMSGLPQLRLIKRLADNYTAERDRIIERLETIRSFLLGGRAMIVSFTGSADVYGTLLKTLRDWRSATPLSGDANRKVPIRIPDSPAREGLAGPMQVAYCTMACPAPHVSDPSAPVLSVGASLLLSEYILPEIRFKGTAYGGGCGYSAFRQLWQFYSYRDPWITRSLKVYEQAPEFVRRAEWTQLDVDRAIIGTAKDAERPIRPGAATGAALIRHLIGDTRDRRDARHTALLQTKVKDVKQMLEAHFAANLPQASTCVVSSREKLESANRDTPDRPLAIEDVSV